MATLILAILMTGTLPALLPRWRHALLVAGAFLAALAVAFLYFLRDLGENPSGGDGPAFATFVVLFGCAQAIVAASLIGRLIAHRLARALTLPTKSRVVKFLLAFSLVPCALAVALATLHYASNGLIGLAVVVFFPFFWLGLALQLASNNSFKPMPLRGTA